jgi:DNA-directed RNA polymerase subunit RPC12/RpoP
VTAHGISRKKRMALFGKFAKDAKASICGTPAEYELTGKVISCGHCGHRRFRRTRPFGMVFAVPVFKPVTLECENCGRVLWFSRAPRMREQRKGMDL